MTKEESVGDDLKKNQQREKIGRACLRKCRKLFIFLITSGDPILLHEQ